MKYVEIFLLLMTFVCGLGILARRFTVPYPIFFVLGGLVISLVPGLPKFTLDPDLTFFLFLPPLLYMQAFYTSWRDFLRNIRPISMLAIGLVLVTTATVALVSHWLIPDFPLAAGFVLGAIVSPPDAIAASAIAEHLHLPRRVITILEGESLVNDATGLVAFKLALAVLGGMVFSGHWAITEFSFVSLGGVIVGLTIGKLVGVVRRVVAGDGIHALLTLSLLTPYCSYLLADQLGASGVLAVVATGLYLSHDAPEVLSAQVRIQASAVWDMLVYWLNGVIFVIIGLQLPTILHGLTEDWFTLLEYAAAVCATCVVVRVCWMFPGAYLPRLLSKRLREYEGPADWRHVMVIGWSGMRGVVSLAAALALSGRPGVPQVALIQFLAFSVILFTLVFQGLTMPMLIKYLGVGDDGIAAREELQARNRMIEAALAQLSDVRLEDKYPETLVSRIENYYRERILTLNQQLSHQLGKKDHGDFVKHHYHLRRLMITTERRVMLEMRRSGRIGDDVMHKLQRELDMEDARLKEA